MIRDHPDRPPALQRLVLYCLALRMDWETGCGFASTETLAADASAEERTVRRATRWGRQADLLLQTRRGHYISPETSVASEWQLTGPGYPQDRTQPATGGRLADPTGQNGRPNRPVAQHHQYSSTSIGRAPRIDGQPRGHPPAIAALCGRCGSRRHTTPECTV